LKIAILPSFLSTPYVAFQILVAFPGVCDRGPAPSSLLSVLSLSKGFRVLAPPVKVSPPPFPPPSRSCRIFSPGSLGSFSDLHPSFFNRGSLFFFTLSVSVLIFVAWFYRRLFVIILSSFFFFFFFFFFPSYYGFRRSPTHRLVFLEDSPCPFSPSDVRQTLPPHKVPSFNRVPPRERIV